MTDRLNPEALEQAAVLDGEHHERAEWNNIEGEIQEQYLEDARRTITNYLAALPEPDSTLITDELTRVAEALHGDDCPDDPDPGEACTCDGDTYYRMAEVALEAAAQPRTITGEQVNRAGWTCYGIHEPGNYATCEECREACDDLANFYNKMHHNPVATKTWTGQPTEGGGE